MKIGQKISFRYPLPNGFMKDRVIEITNLNDQLVTGKTEESDYKDFCSFKRQNMRYVKALDGPTEVNCHFVRARENAIDKLKNCNGEELAQVFALLYKDTVEDVHFDSKTSSVAYSLIKKEPCVEVYRFYCGDGFEFSLVAKDRYGNDTDYMEIAVNSDGNCFVDDAPVLLRELCKMVLKFYEDYDG
jgi:hypothetical protein